MGVRILNGSVITSAAINAGEEIRELSSPYSFLDESPRWLVAKDKTDAARELLQRIAKKNGSDKSGIIVDKLLSARIEVRT